MNILLETAAASGKTTTANSIFEEATTLLTKFGWKVIGALIALIIGLILIHGIKKGIKRLSFIKRLDHTGQGVVKNVLNVLLYAILVVTLAGILGIPLSAFVTLMATAGVAVSLALQGVLSNVVGGVMLLVTKPFRVDDFITVGDICGTVKEIRVLNTVIDTYDNTRISVPNSSLTNVAVYNHTARSTRRSKLLFEVDAAADIEVVNELILSLERSEALVLEDPTPDAFLDHYAEGVMTFAAVFWVKKSDFIAANTNMTKSITKALIDKGWAMPKKQVNINMSKE